MLQIAVQRNYNYIQYPSACWVPFKATPITLLALEEPKQRNARDCIRATFQAMFTVGIDTFGPNFWLFKSCSTCNCGIGFALVSSNRSAVVERSVLLSTFAGNVYRATDNCFNTDLDIKYRPSRTLSGIVLCEAATQSYLSAAATMCKYRTQECCAPSAECSANYRVLVSFVLKTGTSIPPTITASSSLTCPNYEVHTIMLTATIRRFTRGVWDVTATKLLYNLSAIRSTESCSQSQICGRPGAFVDCCDSVTIRHSNGRLAQPPSILRFISRISNFNLMFSAVFLQTGSAEKTAR